MIDFPIGISPIAIVSTLSGGLMLIPLIIYRRRKLNKFLKKWYREMINELLDYEPEKKEIKTFIKFIKKELKGKSYYEIKYDLKQILEDFKYVVSGLSDNKTTDEIRLELELKELKEREESIIVKEDDLKSKKEDLIERIKEIDLDINTIHKENINNQKKDAFKKSIEVSKEQVNNRRLLNKIEQIIRKPVIKQEREIEKSIVKEKTIELVEEIIDASRDIKDELEIKITQKDKPFLGV